jgi:regulator of sigma E protease
MILDILVMLVVLGVVVLVHEIGHFLGARLTGIKAEVFSIGFGKKLLKKNWKGTEFTVSLIPLGGYVKMAGETEFETGKQKPYYFQAKNRMQRFLVLFLGPLMNLLLAFLLLAFMFMSGRQVDKYQTQPPRIGYVLEGSAAQQAGIRKGDLILRIGNRRIENWRDLEMAIGANPGISLEVEYQREGENYSGTIIPDEDRETGIGQAGWVWKAGTRIMSVSEGFPAREAGLEVGDIIQDINGQPVNPLELSRVIGESHGNPLTVRVQRGDEFLTFQIEPRETDEGYIIGVQTGFHFETTTRRYGLFRACKEAVLEMGELIGATVEAIRKMVVGQLSPKTLSGPIAIAKYSRQTLVSGLGNFLTFIAFISLQLGIINLLPIPVLDGGNLMILSLEGLFRRDFNARVKNSLMYLGFAFLMVLMGFVILNDIARELPNGWNSLLPF